MPEGAPATTARTEAEPSVAGLSREPWDRVALRRDLEPFVEVYRERPFARNESGMQFPHMFAVWSLCRMLQPRTIVESGVWRGAGTWLLRRAAPDAHIVAIEPVASGIRHREPGVAYRTDDFSALDWRDVDVEHAFVLFDDHQNALERIKQCLWFGFRHVAFEDNYPPDVGDCYSLKKVLAGTGFAPPPTTQPRPRRRDALMQRFGYVRPTQPGPAPVAPNEADRFFLRRHLEIYAEFPPVVRSELTRWGAAWTDDTYPTPTALLSMAEARALDPVIVEEATAYTWLCYARLRG